ncbi:UNKNOWN [Stylonychia lemnae]|uniref:Uncharacterized protein n=1 Tax=Stylonychia lemnae TaxID=5949 RepID=A0A077ZXK0_STYLE|nr:UNKNOWN [Stylonychia lemnae]|eukprot:CDW74630.1 UNKNOWN [Stylonychia lemnae]
MMLYQQNQQQYQQQNQFNQLPPLQPQQMQSASFYPQYMHYNMSQQNQMAQYSPQIQQVQQNQKRNTHITQAKIQAIAQKQTQQQEELKKLEVMEKELSNILDYAEQSNFETIYRIYQNIINNADLASQQIDNHDPIKKQWYKKVLQYQIKEKKYRDKLQQLYFKYQDQKYDDSIQNKEALKNQALQHIMQESLNYSPQKQTHWLDNRNQVVQNNQVNQQLLNQMNQSFNQQNYDQGGMPNTNSQLRMSQQQTTTNPFVTFQQQQQMPRAPSVQSLASFKNYTVGQAFPNQDPRFNQLNQVHSSIQNPFLQMNSLGHSNMSFESANNHNQQRVANFQIANDSLNSTIKRLSLESINPSQSIGIPFQNVSQQNAVQNYLIPPAQQVFTVQQQQLNVQQQSQQNKNNNLNINSNFLSPISQQTHNNNLADSLRFSPNLQVSVQPSQRSHINSSMINYARNPFDDQPIRPANYNLSFANANIHSSQDRSSPAPRPMDPVAQKDLEKIKADHQKMVKQYEDEIKSLNEHKKALEQKAIVKATEIKNSSRVHTRNNSHNQQNSKNNIEKVIVKTNDQNQVMVNPFDKLPSSRNQKVISNHNSNQQNEDQMIRQASNTLSAQNQQITRNQELSPQRSSKNTQSNRNLGQDLKKQDTIQSQPNVNYYDDSEHKKPNDIQLMKRPWAHDLVGNNSDAYSNQNEEEHSLQEFKLPFNRLADNHSLSKPLQFHPQQPTTFGLKQGANSTVTSRKRLQFLDQFNQPKSKNQLLDEIEQAEINSITSNSMHLFKVEKAPTIARNHPNQSFRGLADEDEISVNRFDEVMMDNCILEKMVNKNIIQRQFDTDNELVNTQNIYELVEEYYNALQPSNHTNLKLSIFGQLDISKKLKQISNMLMQTNAYRYISMGNQTGALFKELDQALKSLGLPSMKDFVKQQQEYYQIDVPNSKNQLRRPTYLEKLREIQPDILEKKSMSNKSMSMLFVGQNDSEYAMDPDNFRPPYQ